MKRSLIFIKKLSFIFLVILSLSCSKTKMNINDQYKLGLKGNVYALSETEYESINGRHPKERFVKKSVTAFNKEGNKLSEIWYNEAGDTLRRYAFVYNIHGLKIKEKYYESNNELFLEGFFEYNNNGQLTASTWQYADGSIDATYGYQYYPNGLTMESVFSDADGNLAGKHTFKYDAAGNLIEDYWENAVFFDYSWKIRYEYNNKNMMIKDVSYDKDGKQTASSSYEYELDNAGNWIQKTEVSNGLPVRIFMREITYSESK